MTIEIDGLDLDGLGNLANILEASPDCVKILDLEGRLTSINRAGIRFLCIENLSEWIGRRWADFLPQEALSEALDALHAARGGQTVRLSAACYIPCCLKHCDVTIAPLRDLNGQVVAMLAISRDVTELVRERDAAQAATKAKSEFLANMSHEIRTPLHGILGMAQVMDRDALNDDQRERLAVIRQSGDILMDLLNDILDLSKIEAGMLDIDMRGFDLAATLQATCAPFIFLANQKDVAFDVTLEPPLDGRLWGDDRRIRQIVANLVSNAVKFTASGAIAVRAAVAGDDLRIIVADTGSGMDPEQVSKLFQSFTQGGSSVSRRFGGTGLGLAISRQLAELMRGHLVVETAAGEGTTFTLTLPVGRSLDEIEHAPMPPTHRECDALRMLAAEDNQTNQLILRSMLAPLGSLHLVDNGHAAIEAFAAQRFDVVLMDIQMPGLNGVEATRAIRKLEISEGRELTPILALSANVMSHQVAEYLASGMNGVVEKPIDIGKLYAAIDHTLPRPDQTGDL